MNSTKPQKSIRKRKSVFSKTLGTDADEIDDVDEVDEALPQTIRQYDRNVWIVSFLCHSNNFAPAVIRKHFSEKLLDTDSIFIKARIKFINKC